MRENPVPCVHATLYESKLGRHITWNDDRMCNPCRRTLDMFIEKQRTAHEQPTLEENETYEYQPT